jgi:DTW domain-containing protein YfiP
MNYVMLTVGNHIKKCSKCDKKNKYYLCYRILNVLNYNSHCILFLKITVHLNVLSYTQKKKTFCKLKNDHIQGFNWNIIHRVNVV